MKLSICVILLAALVLLSACSRKELSLPPEPKEYWALETRYFDTQEGRWKPDQQLLFDRVNLINQDKAQTFQLEAKYGTIEVAKNFTGVSVLVLRQSEVEG